MDQHAEDRDFGQQRGALWPFFKKLLKYAVRYKVWFIPFIGMTLLVAVADAVYPLLWLNYIDNLITPLVTSMRDGGDVQSIDWSGFYTYGLLYLGLAIAQLIGATTFIYYGGKIEEYMVHDLRRDMFDKLQHLSFSFYDKSAIGWLISRITSDSGRVTDLISWGLLSLVWGLMMIIACFVAMFFYSWKLTLVVLFTIPLLFVLSIKLRLRVLQFSRESRRIHSEMTAVFNEHVHGIEVNKTTAQEDQASTGFGRISRRMERASYRAAFFSSMYGPVVVMVGSVAAGLIIYLGGEMVVAEAGITLGILAAFFSYARIIYEPILDITRFYAAAQGSLSAGERIFSLIEEDIQIFDRPDVVVFDPIQGEIEFDSVNFHYVPEKPILQDMVLHIKPGESIALVGPTGEGKSTITNLICRFYEPVSGSIKIDGVDYRERTLASFREQLGIILQTPHMFSGTVLENLRYARHDATHAEVADVLRQIGAEDMISRLDEQVGEEGSSLSLGEKQLLAFARVILKEPKILIMDEATSSVDTLAELRIQRGIETLIKGRTSIIIAHRLSTIKNCDRIFVIRGGKVIESGSHDALIDKKGFYYDLYTKQSRSGVAG